jgi:long-subunit fatty acid transport protein
MHDLYNNESKTYSENGGFGNFDYLSNVHTRGFGYNLKLGLIYRPTATFRIGAAIHTPTFYNLKETYSSEMHSDLQNVSTDANGTHSELTPIGDYQYKLESPFRAIGSLAYQFGKKGLLSFDYEYVDYSKMKLRQGQDGYNFAAENQDINTIYRAVSNIHVGGEFKATNALSLRAGYELYGNHYNSVVNGITQPNTNFNLHTINAGLGYRIDNVSLDVAYSLSDRTNYMYIFQPDGTPDLGYKTPDTYQLNGAVVSPVKYHSLLSEVVFTIAIKL